MSEPIDSQSYCAFKERTFGTDYMIWHDGLYVGAVTALVGAARDEALAMLRYGLAAGDSHAAEALTAMGDQDSREAILARIARADGTNTVRFALAAHALVPDPALAAHLVGVLQGGDPWSVRIDAAIGLRAFAGADDERALLETIASDSDYLVRYHACESLLKRWRIEPREISKHPVIFDCIRSPAQGTPSAEHYAQYAEARAMMLRLRP